MVRRERGNRGRRVEGMRFLRPWGNFVPVLIDFGPFEILLAIKLTVCRAMSKVLQTLFFLNRLHMSQHPTSLSFPKLMPPTTQEEQVSSSNWDLHGINESIKTSHSHQLPANTDQWLEDCPASAAVLLALSLFIFMVPAPSGNDPFIGSTL